MGKRAPLPTEPMPDTGLTKEILDDMWKDRMRDMQRMRNVQLAVNLAGIALLVAGAIFLLSIDPFGGV